MYTDVHSLFSICIYMTEPERARIKFGFYVVCADASFNMKVSAKLLF